MSMKKQLAPTRFAVSLAALSLVALSACGDDPDAAGPPVLIVSQSADASRSAAPVASEAAGMTADGKFMPYFQMRLVAGVDLPALDSDAPAYEIRSSEPDLDVLTSAFGLESDFVANDPANGGGWTAGATDGTEPSMSVYTWSGMTSWSYSPAWAESMSSSVECAVVGMPAGDTTSDTAVDSIAPVPECTTPEPPVNVPTKAAAETKFAEVIGALGVDTSNLAIESYADEWSASVTGYLLVDGVRSPLTYSVGFGAEGSIQWASGFLGDVVKVADYPRIGTAAALDRLNGQMSFVGPRVMVDAVATSDAAATDAVAAPSDTLAVDVPATEPVTSEPVATEPEMTEPEIQDVTIVGVEEELQMLYGDNVTYLVPGYAFLAETQDQYTPRYSVVAIPDEYIQESVPTAAGEAVAVPEPAVVGVSGGSVTASTDGAVVDAEALFVGQTEDEAAVTAKANGLEVRVVERDGEEFAVTMDYRTDRVNIAVTDDKVTFAYIG